MKRIASILAVVMGMLIPGAARAQGGEVAVKAEVNATRVYVGDSLTLQVTVEGARSATPPDLSKLDGFTAQYVGAQDASSQSVTIINGRMQRNDSLRFIMQWRLTPARKGKLTIPALTVAVGGQNHTTEPIPVAAVEPAESPDFRLTLEADKTTAYVGEPLKLRLTWYLGKKVTNIQFTGSDGGQVFDIAPGPDPRPGGRDDQRFPVVPFLGMQAVGRLGTGDMDGVQVTALVLDLIVTPRQAGAVQVGPFTAAFQAIIGQRPAQFFDAPWDNRSITERVVVASNAVTLDVKPLPEAGKPAGFNGLIGEYGISASAGAGEASVGDPVPLTVRITGPEPMDSVKAPELSGMPGFDAFKLAPEGWQAGTVQKAGERVFSTTVRPRSDRVTEIPPVELSFFDTAGGQYRTARSNPIPLKVAPSREVTAADAIGARARNAPSAPAATGPGLESGLGGIHANYEDDDALVDQGTSLVEWAGHPAGALLLAGPPAVCLALSIARGRRASQSEAARRRRAISRARSLLRRADRHEQVLAGVRAYLGGALGAEPGAITSTDARAMLTGAGSTLGERIGRLCEQCEGARFGAEPREAGALRDEARSLLGELHRELERLS